MDENETDLKVDYIDPHEPIHEGMQNRRRISMEEAEKTLPKGINENMSPLSECQDKDSTHYFVCHMTQKEFEERTRNGKIAELKFNLMTQKEFEERARNCKTAEPKFNLIKMDECYDEQV